MASMIRYGLIGGGLLLIPMFGPWLLLGPNTTWMKIGEVVGYTAMVLCLSATWFAMRRERDLLGGIGYGRAFRIGLGVSAVAALLFGAATWLFFIVAGEAVPQAMYEFYVDNVRTSGASAESIAAQLAELEAMRPMFFNYPLQALVMAATVFLIGAVESALGAWFASRNRAPVASPA